VTALGLGASFVARSFSGDKKQLIPIIKAGIKHKGFALIDVISPCVTFNNHEGSTKSYHHTREFVHEAVHTDYVPAADEITAHTTPGKVTTVKMHDGSSIQLKSVDENYDPTNATDALNYLQTHTAKGEIVTGLLYINENSEDMHSFSGTTDTPLVDIDYSELCPGSAKLPEMLGL